MHSITKTILIRYSLFLFILLWLVSATYAQESVCYGTTANGKLKHGVKLPSEGVNYVSYSKTAELLGRTYVHSKVKAIIVASYQQLEAAMPQKVYKYAETGFKQGGKFSPHKTHQNGLSVDFMVPVINQQGQSTHLPTHYLNRLGYDIEFDRRGHYENYRIDYEALAAHLVYLHKAAIKQNVNLKRVIFALELQPFLLKTKYGSYIKQHIRLSTRPAWVRHDEHYHVDFDIPCVKNK